VGAVFLTEQDLVSFAEIMCILLTKSKKNDTMLKIPDGKSWGENLLTITGSIYDFWKGF
jgi:hypothetical protein